jgi:5-methylcytosine-specific restriction enzyme A
MDDPRYHTKRWQQLRVQVIRRDGKRCAYPYCTSDMDLPFMIHVDHIVEVDDGGPFWDPANLQTFCKPHHVAKTLNVRASRPQPVSPNG